jgi:3-hydroxyacyl-CoA dehydrogenase
MQYKVEKAAVLGAGVMGSQLAAHLSNAGIPSYLFDISQELAEKGLQNALGLKPPPFYNPKTAEMITPCNYDEHLDRLQEVDWVIEAVAERMDIKHKVFESIAPKLKPTAIVTSNTSGLPLKGMAEGMPLSFRQHFLITHFFNPPRYMRLLEIVAGKDTLPEVVKFIAGFCEEVLGKGIVYAKDTPNFIANRIGTYGMMLTLKLAQEMNLTVEEVDKLTGEIIGRAKSATFRTADIVGLDTLAHVVRTSYENLPEDEERDIFQIPEFLQQMLDNGWLGQKTRKGFYHKTDGEILSLDLNTLEYKPQKRVRFDGYRVAKGYATTPERIRALAFADDKAGRFIWEILSRTLIYSANRIPEIADDIVNVDRAMRWGFGWELGPFETWDALGVERAVRRMEKEGKKVPGWVREMLSAGHSSFYSHADGQIHYFDVSTDGTTPVVEHPKVIRLELEKEKGKTVRRNWSASLIDIGDGIACIEFHSPLQPTLNPIDAAMIDMLAEALDVVKEEGFRGLLIGHQGPNFSAGANLALILELCRAKAWDKIEAISKALQDAGQALKFAPFPVVSAPFHLCLGGGYEVAAAANRIVAAAELYCGAVEVGVGLIPGAGANLRLLLNSIDAMAKRRPGPFPPVQKAFETIAYARVSSSAKEAVAFGYLRRDDRIILNLDHLIFEAKQTALEMADGYEPPTYRDDIVLPGKEGRLAIEGTLDNLLKAGKISEHDRLILGKLAYVLTGGDVASPTRPVDEQTILDLEREAFVSLCAEPLSQARMEHMLKTGKPLRN